MWNVTEKDRLPSMSLGASNVDWRYVADEIPQKFRSQESKAEAFNSFCIEAVEKEETSSSFQSSLIPSSESASFHSQYTFNNSSGLNSNIEGYSQTLKGVKEICETEDFPPYPVPVNLSETFLTDEHYPHLWNRSNREDCSNFSSNKFQTNFDSNLFPSAAKPEEILDKNSAYPLQDIQSFENCDVDLDNNPEFFNSVCYENLNPKVAAENFPYSSLETRPDMAESLKAMPMKETILNSEEPLTRSPAIHQPVVSNVDSNASCGSGNKQNCKARFNDNNLGQHSFKNPANSSTYSFQNPSIGSLQQFSSYNLFSSNTNAQNFGKEKPFSQNTRDNSGIKLHIRTITHCELECPAPGSHPLSNQPCSLEQNLAPQSQLELQSKQLKNDILPDKMINSVSWSNPQNMNNSECYSHKDETQARSNNDIEVIQSNQIFPLQSGCSNPFQNGAGNVELY